MLRSVNIRLFGDYRDQFVMGVLRSYESPRQQQAIVHALRNYGLKLPLAPGLRKSALHSFLPTIIDSADEPLTFLPESPSIQRGLSPTFSPPRISTPFFSTTDFLATPPVVGLELDESWGLCGPPVICGADSETVPWEQYPDPRTESPPSTVPFRDFDPSTNLGSRHRTPFELGSNSSYSRGLINRSSGIVLMESEPVTTARLECKLRGFVGAPGESNQTVSFDGLGGGGEQTTAPIVLPPSQSEIERPIILSWPPEDVVGLPVNHRIHDVPVLQRVTTAAIKHGPLMCGTKRKRETDTAEARHDWDHEQKVYSSMETPTSNGEERERKRKRKRAKGGMAPVHLTKGKEQEIQRAGSEGSYRNILGGPDNPIRFSSSSPLSDALSSLPLIMALSQESSSSEEWAGPYSDDGMYYDAHSLFSGPGVVLGGEGWSGHDTSVPSTQTGHAKDSRRRILGRRARSLYDIVGGFGSCKTEESLGWGAW